MDGWYQRASSRCRPWYGREVVVGPLRFRMDVWPAGNDDAAWCYSINNGKAEHTTLSSAEKAMTAADVSLAGWLRAAARMAKG